MMRRATNAKNKPITSLIAASKVVGGRQSKQESVGGGGASSGLTH